MKIVKKKPELKKDEKTIKSMVESKLAGNVEKSEKTSEKLHKKTKKAAAAKSPIEIPMPKIPDEVISGAVNFSIKKNFK